MVAGKDLLRGTINALGQMLYGTGQIKGVGDAFIRGAGCGAAVSGLENIAGALGLTGRDPKSTCGSTDPFDLESGLGGSRGYHSQRGNRGGFSLGSFVKDTLTGAVAGGLGSAGFYGAGKAVEALRGSVVGRRSGRDLETSRVGRWMSKAEYQKMVETGYVQKPYMADQSYVANPADYNAFYKQASKGTVYVESDVPSVSLKQTKDVWAMIPGPNSIYSKINVKKGLAPYDFPKVKNISLIGEK